MKDQIEEMANDIRECHVEYADDYDDCVDVFTDYAATAEKMMAKGYRKQIEWISVDERLPESSCECLVATTIGAVYQVNYSHRHKAFNATDEEDGNEYAMHTVTHWMPLPEPPKMKGGAKE